MYRGFALPPVPQKAFHLSCSPDERDAFPRVPRQVHVAYSHMLRPSSVLSPEMGKAQARRTASRRGRGESAAHTPCPLTSPPFFRAARLRPPCRFFFHVLPRRPDGRWRGARGREMVRRRPRHARPPSLSARAYARAICASMMLRARRWPAPDAEVCFPAAA